MRTEDGTVSLDPGNHTIELSFWQGSGGFGMILSYSGPDTADEMMVIPPSVLLPPSGYMAPVIETTTTTTTTWPAGAYLLAQQTSTECYMTQRTKTTFSMNQNHIGADCFMYLDVLKQAPARHSDGDFWFKLAWDMEDGTTKD
eukprot:6482456-Amphidinium_carterae.1